MNYQQKLERHLKIKQLHKAGESFKDIGKIFSISGCWASKLFYEKPKKGKEVLPILKPIRVKKEPQWGSGRDMNREKVRIRDNYTCQDCGKKWVTGMRRFDIHHLNGLWGKKSKGYDSVNDLSGLNTLCHKCHFNRPEHTIKKKLSTG